MTRGALALPTVVLVSLAPALGRAQASAEIESILYRAADALGMLRTPGEVDRIVTLLFTGTGTKLVNGAPCELTSYRAGVRFPIPDAANALPAPGMRIDYSCATSGEAPERHVEVVADRTAWNETEPGIGATPAPETARERLFRVWTLPQGLIKAAAAAGNAVTLTSADQKPVLSFPLPAPLDDTTVAVTFDPAPFLSHTMPNGTEREFTHRIETVSADLDGIAIEIRYADYRDWNEPDYQSDVLLPGRTTITHDGQTVLDLTLTGSNTYNPYVVMPIPAGLTAAAAER
jgi:hypothetical protein